MAAGGGAGANWYLDGYHGRVGAHDVQAVGSIMGIEVVPMTKPPPWKYSMMGCR